MPDQLELLEAGCWIGRQQAFAIIATKCSAAQAECLKQAKDERLFERLGLSWDDYCSTHAGISRSTADRIIQQYREFGSAYFKLSNLARIEPETYRRIAADVNADSIQIAGESVALTPANSEKIRAYVQSLRTALHRERERTEPSLQELHARLGNLIKELDRRVHPTMPNVLQEYLLSILKDGAKNFDRIAKILHHMMHPET